MAARSFEVPFPQPAPTYRTARRRCVCRHEIDHPLVRAEGRYSVLKLTAMFLGISTHPYRIDYACSVCHEVLGSTSDPERLKRYY